MADFRPCLPHLSRSVYFIPRTSSQNLVRRVRAPSNSPFLTVSSLESLTRQMSLVSYISTLTHLAANVPYVVFQKMARTKKSQPWMLAVPLVYENLKKRCLETPMKHKRTTVEPLLTGQFKVPTVSKILEIKGHA